MFRGGILMGLDGILLGSDRQMEEETVTVAVMREQ